MGEALRLAWAAIPAVGVGAQPLVATAAEKVVDRLLERPAFDVPAGDLDGADSAAVDLPALAEDVAPEFLCDQFGLERVHPNDQRLQFVNHRLDGLGERVDGAFADAVNALVGFDPREQPVLPRVATDDGADVSDFHEVTLACIALSCPPANQRSRTGRVPYRTTPAQRSTTTSRLAA